MNSYFQQILFGIVVILPFSLFFVWSYFPQPLTLMLPLTCAFLGSSFLLHPAMNMRNQTRLFSFIGALSLPLRPYYFLLDHLPFPFAGTLLRLIYVTIAGFLVLYVLQGKLPSYTQLFFGYFLFKKELFAAFAGTMLSDVSHYMAKGLTRSSFN